MVATMENEITKEINIEHRFHRTMIGTKGEKIREIRDQYNQVSAVDFNTNKSDSHRNQISDAFWRSARAFVFEW